MQFQQISVPPQLVSLADVFLDVAQCSSMEGIFDLPPPLEIENQTRLK